MGDEARDVGGLAGTPGGGLGLGGEMGLLGVAVEEPLPLERSRGEHRRLYRC